jgi:hypothetical protein
MKILLVQPKSSGFMGQISRSGKAGFARVTLTTLAALNPVEITMRTGISWGSPG